MQFYYEQVSKQLGAGLTRGAGIWAAADTDQ